ncbi:MAG: class I SAM-dependent methyltransferase [Gemmatimonadota bacterium]|nr:class I SAM-dependent methyltransferase [Gemmatimonadota bacterium]
MGREHAGADRYGALVSSEAYLRSRERKAEVIWHLCAPWLREAAVAADLGAGTGLIRAALERRAGHPVLGFEIDLSFVVDRSRMVGADVLRLPLRDGTVDFALLNHLYEHVPDVAGLLRETFRVLRRGGRAYVSAGSRFAVLEPHYRLPFLSWLPAPAATLYLRLSGRGRRYEGIRFLGYRALRERMEAAGFEVDDITEAAIDDLLGRLRGPALVRAWRLFRRLPGVPRRLVLRALSPQWFFVVRKPESAA